MHHCFSTFVSCQLDAREELARDVEARKRRPARVHWVADCGLAAGAVNSHEWKCDVMAFRTLHDFLGTAAPPAEAVAGEAAVPSLIHLRALAAVIRGCDVADHAYVQGVGDAILRVAAARSFGVTLGRRLSRKCMDARVAFEMAGRRHGWTCRVAAKDGGDFGALRDAWLARPKKKAPPRGVMAGDAQLEPVAVVMIGRDTFVADPARGVFTVPQFLSMLMKSVAI
jgi:hypothetical protein